MVFFDSTDLIYSKEIKVMAGGGYCCVKAVNSWKEALPRRNKGNLWHICQILSENCYKLKQPRTNNRETLKDTFTASGYFPDKYKHTL